MDLKKVLFFLFITGIFFPLISSANPQVFLNSPKNNSYISLDPAEFNCTFYDADYPDGNLTLWGNFSGSWAEDQRYEVSSGDLTHVFTKSLSEGEYLWTCMSEDNTSIQVFGENRTFTIDLTAPTIEAIYFNETSSCGNTTLKFTCNTSDNHWVEEVLAEIETPTLNYNRTMGFVSGTNYSLDILVNETGNWTFKCYSRDNASNYNSLALENFSSYSGYPELFVNGSRISFSKQNPIEGENINVSAVIENIGCVGSSNFNVSFFKDSVSWNNQLGQNQTLSLSSFTETIVNLTYSIFIGKNNIFVFADSALNIIEEIESNNEDNQSLSMTLWQEFYGNVSAVKILGSNSNFSSWGLKEQVLGNVFITDSEANVDWFSLVPLGENLTGSESLDDFSEVDTLFGTTGFNDSIYNEYLDQSQIRYKDSFLVNKKYINNVPVINSTNNANFLTGILWDSSDDGGDGEFSPGDKEDLIFITEINEGKQGKYGAYDYEFRVPVTLRSYDSTDSSGIYLYYNLI